jgi:hypothetical protein
MKVANEKIISAADMSADFESQPLLIEQCYGFGFQCIFTGSPDGAMKLQASNDDVQLEDQVLNWTDIANSNALVTAAGDLMYNFNGAIYKWVKIVYVFSSGTGSCDVTFLAKGI